MYTQCSGDGNMEIVSSRLPWVTYRNLTLNKNILKRLERWLSG